MILILRPDVGQEEVRRVLEQVERFPGVTAKTHEIRGTTRTLTEVYLIGSTATLPEAAFAELPGVERVVRIQRRYRLLGRHAEQIEAVGFECNGVRFDQETCQVFAGLCAVDTREHTALMMARLAAVGLRTARMGAYKPRTSPYDFQGLGKECLPWVFELAGRYGLRVIAMEITHESQIDEIRAALAQSGQPTAVMLQIGTRNAQNFELLKLVGQQTEMPVLFKRGMGITLEESLNACEYIASEGNRNIVFCLRGVQSHLGDPHRNLVDFAHVPVVRRLTRLPVCIDPSHSVGRRERGPDGILDLWHATAQGVIAGANMVLVDFHPAPEHALCDGPQALLLDELEPFLADVGMVRETYERRLASARKAPH